MSLALLTTTICFILLSGCATQSERSRQAVDQQDAAVHRLPVLTGGSIPVLPPGGPAGSKVCTTPSCGQQQRDMGPIPADKLRGLDQTSPAPAPSAPQARERPRTVEPTPPAAGAQARGAIETRGTIDSGTITFGQGGMAMHFSYSGVGQNLGFYHGKPTMYSSGVVEEISAKSIKLSWNGKSETFGIGPATSILDSSCVKAKAGWKSIKRGDSYTTKAPVGAAKLSEIWPGTMKSTEGGPCDCASCN
jgi:hypothetical protein